MIRLIIPKEISLGDRVFKIEFKQKLPQFCLGRIHHNEGVIEIATHDARNNARSADAMYETFWHEVVHGVLFQMTHEYWDNEEFVAEFAAILTDVMLKAKL